MRHLLTIAAAIVCGIIAFVLNAAYLSSRTKPLQYVAIKSTVAAGEACDKSVFTPMEVPADLKTAAIPYSEVATLWGRRAARDLEPGELVLRQDIVMERADMQLAPGETGLHIPVESLHLEPGLLRVGMEIGFVVPRASADASNPAAVQQFEQLGPFRIVSINSDVADSPYEGDDASSARIANITVAARLQTDGIFEGAANRLIDAASKNQVHAITFNGQQVKTVATLK